jgi:hypothetical protein
MALLQLCRAHIPVCNSTNSPIALLLDNNGANNSSRSAHLTAFSNSASCFHHGVDVRLFASSSSSSNRRGAAAGSLLQVLFFLSPPQNCSAETMFFFVVVAIIFLFLLLLFCLPTPFVCCWEFVSSLCTAATMSRILLDRRLGSVAIFLSHAPRTFLFLLGLQPWNTEAHGV